MREPKKFDTDKPRYDLLPPKALGLLVDCLTYGAKKYDDYNWRKDGGIDPNRLFAATQRHLFAWKDGEVMDKESGLPHLAHAATNLLMMLDLACRPLVKIPNFSPPSAPELRPIQGWPYQEIEKAMKQVGGSKKTEPASYVERVLSDLRAHSIAYDVVSEPENTRFFAPYDAVSDKLKDLGLFAYVRSFVLALGEPREEYARTTLGYAVREAIHAKS